MPPPPIHPEFDDPSKDDATFTELDAALASEEAEELEAEKPKRGLFRRRA